MLFEVIKFFGSTTFGAIGAYYLQNHFLYETQKKINPKLDDHLINLQGLVNSIKLAREKDKEENKILIEDFKNTITDLNTKVESYLKEIELFKKQQNQDMQTIGQLKNKILQLTKSYIYIQQAKWMKDCKQEQANLHGSYTWFRNGEHTYTGKSNIQKDYKEVFQNFKNIQNL